MIFRAAFEHKINFNKSWLIGDSTTDISAANKVGIKSILLKTGFGGKDLKEKVLPNYIFDNLEIASKWITKEYPIVRNSVISNIDKLKEQKVILISGLNHCGKSNYAQVMKEVFEGLGLKCYLINTNSWELDLTWDLNEEIKFTNYNMKAIKNFIEKCIVQKSINSS